MAFLCDQLTYNRVLVLLKIKPLAGLSNIYFIVFHWINVSRKQIQTTAE